MKKHAVLFFVLAMLICLAFWGCGGSSSAPAAETSYPVTASVAMPSVGNISAPVKSSLAKAFTETATAGVVVQAEDTAGNAIGSPCTTGADGTCTIALTAAQLEAGVVFVSENMHVFREFEAIDIAAVATTPLTAPVTVEEDMVHAMVTSQCGGDLAACPSTIDRECLHDAVEVLPGDDSPGTSSVDGYIEGLVEAHANAIVNAPTTAGAALITAFVGGDATSYTGAVGAAAVSNVPVADAVTNSELVANKINSAYCTRASAGAASPWDSARAAAASASESVAKSLLGSALVFDTSVSESEFNRAVAGPLEHLTAEELAVYTDEEVQGILAAPAIPGFVNTAGSSSSELARRSIIEAMRQGMLGSNAGIGLAAAIAGWPPPDATTGARDWAGLAYDPVTTTRASRNVYLSIIGSSSFDPGAVTAGGVLDAFKGIISDPSHRTTLLQGGGGDFVSTFLGNPTGFVPADHLGQIQAPPGGACASDSDCLECDSCVSSVCVSGSSLMGSSCEDADDCDDITICVGPPNASHATYAGKNCICAIAGLLDNSGLGVYTTAGDPQQYGTDYTPPANGSEGGFCGPANPCSGGLTCTSSSGVCVDSSEHKFPAGHNCTANSECVSNSCVSSACQAADSERGTKANGQTCSYPRECQSLFCVGGVCTSGSGGNDLKPDGSACTAGSECVSSYCNPTFFVCAQQGGLPTGGACMTNPVCQSQMCDMMTMTCM